MKKLFIVAAISVMFAGSAFAGSTPSTIATGSLNLGASVGGSVTSFGAGSSQSAAFNSQTASFTSAPSSTSNTFGTVNVGLTGTTSTSGQSFAFNSSTGAATGSAFSAGNAAATETGILNGGGGGELGASGIGSSTASNSNISAAGINEAQGNFGATTSQFNVSLTQTVSDGPVFSVDGVSPTGGVPNVSNTATVTGSASNFNEAQTGLAALTAVGLTPTASEIATIAAGTASFAGNTLGNTVISNAGFSANATGANLSTQTLDLPSPNASFAAPVGGL